MAYFSSVNVVMVFFSLCFVACSVLHGSVAVARDQGGDASLDYHHVEVSSLLPQDSCIPFSKSPKRGATVEVVHRQGPCSKVKSDVHITDWSNVEVLLERDEDRVKSIQFQVLINQEPEGSKVGSIRLPARSGASIGTGNYVVTVGLGTPTKSLTLIFDTGSDLTWTQCQPCIRSCYPQVNPIFDPRASTTYRNISCSSALCASVASATSGPPRCSGSTCVYGIQYGDSSFSVGFFATEKLTLSPSDVFPNFKFGCGEDNEGLFRGAAGLIGLGRNPLSAVSQTATRYGNYFSYCLPTQSGTGSLTFGRSASVSAPRYTPLLTKAQFPSFYFLSLQAISVGGRTLPIPPAVFSSPGTIIDSGTVITRLPPTAYTALRNAFRQGMTQYRLTSPLSILDTCYDFSKLAKISVPAITFSFSGGAQLNLGIPGIFYVQSISQVCLAFAGNSNANAITILGNVQQQTFNVIYDVAGQQLGFGPGGCN